MTVFDESAPEIICKREGKSVHGKQTGIAKLSEQDGVLTIDVDGEKLHLKMHDIQQGISAIHRAKQAR